MASTTSTALPDCGDQAMIWMERIRLQHPSIFVKPGRDAPPNLPRCASRVQTKRRHLARNRCCLDASSLSRESDLSSKDAYGIVTLPSSAGTSLLILPGGKLIHLTASMRSRCAPRKQGCASRSGRTERFLAPKGVKLLGVGRDGHHRPAPARARDECHDRGPHAASPGESRLSSASSPSREAPALPEGGVEKIDRAGSVCPSVCAG